MKQKGHLLQVVNVGKSQRWLWMFWQSNRGKVPGFWQYSTPFVYICVIWKWMLEKVGINQKEVCRTTTRCPNLAAKKAQTNNKTQLFYRHVFPVPLMAKLFQQWKPTGQYHQLLLTYYFASQSKHSPEMNRPSSAHSASCSRPKSKLQYLNFPWFADPPLLKRSPSGPLLLHTVYSKFS